MAPSSTKAARNSAQLIADLVACGYTVRHLKVRSRVTHPDRPGETFVPDLLSDDNLGPQIDNLRSKVGYDPDESKRLHREDGKARLERDRKVAPAPVPVFSAPETVSAIKAESAPAPAPTVEPAASVVSSANQKLYDRLYAEAFQIPGSKARVIRVEIDAIMALELLGRNEFWTPDKRVKRETYVRSNRPVEPETVKSYNRDMAANLWRESDLAIAFDWDGQMLNGQHRLLSIQLTPEADIKLPFYLWFDLDPEAWDAYDSGRNRTFTDLAAGDQDTNRFLLGATTRLIMKLDAGQEWRLKVSPVAQRAWKNDPTNAVIKEAVRLGQNAVSPKEVKNNASAMAALAFLVMREMPDRKEGMTTDPLQMFLDGIHWGENVHRTDPRAALRRRFHGKLEPIEKANWFQLATNIKAFNRFLTGTPMQYVKFDPYSEVYPELLKVWEMDQKLAFAKRHRIQAHRG